MTYLRTNNVRHNPLAWPLGFGDLEQQLGSLFAGLPGLLEAEQSKSTPVDKENAKLRWYEKPEAYLVRVDLPGVSKQDIAIELEDGALEVSATRKLGVDAEEQQESGSFHYRRSFRIPEGVLAEKIAAHFENGVLSLTLPKSEKAKPRQIVVG